MRMNAGPFIVVSSAVIALSGALSLIWAEQPEESGQVNWEDRLTQLHPDDPMAYFKLAEEVADRAADENHRELARHLFALACVLDPDHLGRSACLALAELESNPERRRNLIALASLLETTLADPLLAVEDGTAVIDRPDHAALAVSEALSYYRRGQGAMARSALDDPDAMAVLQTVGHVLPGGAEEFLEACKRLKGHGPPHLTQEELVRQLRFESAILSGAERTWSEELLLTNGPSLIEVDPQRLEETLGVDGHLSVYRNGRWERP